MIPIGALQKASVSTRDKWYHCFHCLVFNLCIPTARLCLRCWCHLSEASSVRRHKHLSTVSWSLYDGSEISDLIKSNILYIVFILTNQLPTALLLPFKLVSLSSILCTFSQFIVFSVFSIIVLVILITWLITLNVTLSSGQCSVIEKALTLIVMPHLWMPKQSVFYMVQELKSNQSDNMIKDKPRSQH